MTSRRLIIQTLKYYWRQNLMLALGVAVSTAVLTGALIVGDSVQYSLEKIVQWRLGNITHAVSAGDRYFSDSLAGRLQEEINDPVASLLMLNGMATSSGGTYQLPRVQVLGIDRNFSRVTGVRNSDNSLKPAEALVSRNLAQQLHLKVDDDLLIRMKKLSVIPLNAPFVSNAEAIKPVKVTVAGILADDSTGRFDLRKSQTAPFNIFLSLEFLNEIMDAQGKANYLLITSEASLEIEPALDRVLIPEDININIEFSGVHRSWELTSDRVFINRVIQEALESEQVSAVPILTYFVNTISHGDRKTPYSFVSTTTDATLGPHEIIINDWVGEDLGVSPGDSIKLDYFIIDPLRKLEERSHYFIIKKVVPLSGKWADKSLMPRLPGLSDVGNCRDWETGVPIDLEKIRPKDEDYWDEYRGIPKAYISYGTARNLWTNRFGESTTLRITNPDINQRDLEKSILALVRPLALGFQVSDVRNQGDEAARSGVDFSQLFLGLSSFLLLASFLLTVLLFNLNTRTRMHQLATLTYLGFTRRKVKLLWLTEGLLVSMAGALLGLLLAISYNQIVFNALNSIWSAIVRTRTLETDVNLPTLVTGFSISVFISLVAVYISLNRLLKQSTHKLQTHTLTSAKTWIQAAENVLIFFSSFFALALVIWSYLQTSFQNTAVFFIGGTLILFSCLLFVRKIFQYKLKKIGFTYFANTKHHPTKFNS